MDVNNLYKYMKRSVGSNSNINLKYYNVLDDDIYLDDTNGGTYYGNYGGGNGGGYYGGIGNYGNYGNYNDGYYNDYGYYYYDDNKNAGTMYYSYSYYLMYNYWHYKSCLMQEIVVLNRL